MSTESGTERHCGSCMCGAVTFEVGGSLSPPDACHCTQCRKQSGHYFASTDVPRGALSVTGAEHLAWFQSSERVRRGFCRQCGSSLFWDPVGKDIVGVAMGAFDGTTGTQLAIHIFVAEKGDYYEIADDLPQNLH
jgi:hypothetical protein